MSGAMLIYAGYVPQVHAYALENGTLSESALRRTSDQGGELGGGARC